MDDTDYIMRLIAARRPERCPCCGGAVVIVGTLPRPMPSRTSFWPDTS
jgi:hypothetical protein